MKINVIEEKQVVYWAWGDGGHAIGNGVGGNYITKCPPKVEGQMNHPQPVHHEFLKRVESGIGDYDKFSGWVKRTNEYARTRQQKLDGIPAETYETVYWFLRKLEGDRITLDAQDVHRMRGAAHSFQYDGTREDNERLPIVISEIGLFDADMKLLRVVNLCTPLNMGEAFELVLDFRTAEEIAASDAGWERTENDRAARGALM